MDIEGKHHILIRNRESLEVTGIKKIESLNADSFILETMFGKMTITGINLEMISFDISKGELFIKGIVNAIEYYDQKENKKDGILNKLFK